MRKERCRWWYRCKPTGSRGGGGDAVTNAVSQRWTGICAGGLTAKDDRMPRGRQPREWFVRIVSIGIKNLKPASGSVELLAG